MSDDKPHNPLFRVDSPSYKGQPFNPHDETYKYLGYFQNEHGERWVFGVEKDGRAFLTGNDIDWEVIYSAEKENPFRTIVLNDNEKLWLAACWDASAWYRKDGRQN